MPTSYCTRCGDPLEVGATCPNDGAPAAPLTTFKPEDTIDKYALEALLGIGGMGEVWSARHQTIQKKVAIKFLSLKASGDQATALRFKREALAVNQVQHKNIVDIFDLGETKDGRPFFVMELLQGKDLAARLSKQQPLPFSEILTIISQICRGLQAAHEKGIVHRDLKPENVFLLAEEDGLRVKLLDFGIAKVAGEQESRVTLAGDIFGTPEYMSPEQCEGAKKVDHRADLYSLALILFEMVTGKHPFVRPGDGPGTIIARQLTMPAPLASEVNTWRKLPVEIDDFIEKALSKSPDDRLSSAHEFSQRLQEAAGELRDEISVTRQDGTQISAMPPDFSQDETQQIPSPDPSSDYFVSGPPTVQPPRAAPRGLLIGGVVVACVLLGLGIFLMEPSTTPTAPPNTLPHSLAATQPLPSPETAPASLVVAPATAPASAPEAPRTVTLSFKTEPSGANVYLGKTLLCLTPCEHAVDLQEKPLPFFFAKKGHTSKLVSVTPTQDQAVSATLSKKANDLIMVPLTPR